MLKWLLPRRIKRVHIYFIVATLLLGYYYWTRIIRLRSAQSPSFQEVNRTPKMDIWTARQQEVVAAFRHSWDGYEKYAWGYDELKPVAKEGSDWFHLGLTIIDSLDTSYMMGQMDIFQKARDWTADNLEFKADVNANVFEITIRVLGGLLSAHHLSKDPMFLVKAIELADELLIAFKSPSEIPYSSVNFLHKKAAEAHFDQGASSTSEATTLQLEFKYLTHLTGDPKYWNACQKAMRSVLKNDRPSGLVPIFIDAKTGNFAGNNIRLGKYLAKQYAITNATEPVLLNEWRDSMNGIRQHLLGISRSGVIFVGERDMGLSSSLSTKMDHLVCFLPGTIAMIAKFNASMTLQDTHDFQLAQEILDGCIEMYLQTVTGLSPEIVFWNEAHPVRGPQRTFNLLAYHQTPPLEISPRVTSIHHNDFEIHPLDGHNLLRPETVESLYYLYHYTQDIRYRQVGYTIFEAFLNHTKLDVGFSSIDDVREIHTTFRDKMETFWVGETLKYFYLLFGESTWLDDHVFNTEAHPFPIFELVPELQNIVLKL